MRISGGFQEVQLPHRFRRGPGFPFWTFGAVRTGSRVARDASGAEHVRDARDFPATEPGVPYETTVRRARGGVWAFVSPTPEMLPLMDWPVQSPGMRCLRVEDPSLRREMYLALRATVACLSMAHSRREELALNAFERFLLLARDATPRSAGPARDARVRRVVQLIHQSPERAWTIGELADAASMSESSLTHRFTAELGVSPIRYANGRRIEAAKGMLLGGDMGIAEIAERLGYASAFHFSARFRQLVGKSPRAFRRAPL